MSGDTIFALSSGALPAAIAVVRLSGPEAERAAEQLAGTLPPYRMMGLRSLRDAEGRLIDEALVVRFRAPQTATGEPLVELHCHGGRAVVARLTAVLGAMQGLRLADPGEFTRRALVNGRLDLTRAEGLGDLLAAETEWQRRAAVVEAGGALARQVEEWRSRLVLLAARAEAAIDYVDEEETEPDVGELRAAASTLAAEWGQWLRAPRAELLHCGLRVVLGGPPNAGKSSLFNAIVGHEKAIVTPIAGTTRDVIETRIDLDGIPLTLVDTAGVCDSSDEVERIGVARAQAAHAEADLLLWLGPPSEAPVHPHLLRLHARADVVGPPPDGSLPVSVRTGEGMDRLRAEITRHCAALLPRPDTIALNQRQAQALGDARDALDGERELLLLAEGLRSALSALDRLAGRRATEDVLDALFERFCLGK